jgi:hypothetical protein
MRWVRLPSPAIVVALGALVLSVGGNVTAAALITSASIKDNTIRSVDLRDETIKSVDVHNGTLKGADVASGSLSGGDVANNSLTGADVNESTLGQVPSAADATTAENAAKVDGFDADSLTRVARMGTSAGLALSTSWKSFGDALSLTAPRAGFVMIHGGTTIDATNCSLVCGVTAVVRHIQSGATSVPAQESIPPEQDYANISHAWVFPVNAGVNTFDIRIYRDTGNGALYASLGELAAIYSPFGSAAPPTGN